jgi:Tfp pilus assembly protein PilE
MKPLQLKKKQSFAGFTLLELMVIVVMVGLLAAVAAPSWIGFFNRQRISAVKSDLIQTIKQTQQDAIQRRETVSFEILESEDLPTINNGIDIVLASSSSIKPGMITLDSYTVNADGTKNDDADDVSLGFDYQGKPVAAGTNDDGFVLPFVITISAENSNNKQCVIIANLIGSIKTAEGADCDNPPVDPVDPP